MGNVKEELNECGKWCERIVWVWEMLRKKIISMGNVEEENHEYGKCWKRIVWVREML